ncbi:MAG TPA: hypothetical protein ENN17_06690 [bacterium]|nr:hypothetical protein [bacterium]
MRDRRHRKNRFNRDAAPAALIGVSNHFDAAIATAILLLVLSSCTAFVVGINVWIEKPLRIRETTGTVRPDQIIWMTMGILPGGIGSVRHRIIFG